MLSLDVPVAALVLERSETAAVLDRYQIDYCCGGQRSLREACDQSGLDTAKVLHELELAIHQRAPQIIDPSTLATPELILQVITPHHQYLHHTLPSLQRLAVKVARIHGERAPRLRDLARAVDGFAKMMIEHLDEEERELFPTLLAGDVDEALPHLETMDAEHREVDRALDQLRELAEDFAPPLWACTSYHTLLAELAYLDADMRRHVDVESNVLRPRFLAS